MWTAFVRLVSFVCFYMFRYRFSHSPTVTSFSNVILFIFSQSSITSPSIFSCTFYPSSSNFTGNILLFKLQLPDPSLPSTTALLPTACFYRTFVKSSILMCVKSFYNVPFINIDAFRVDFVPFVQFGFTSLLYFVHLHCSLQRFLQLPSLHYPSCLHQFPSKVTNFSTFIFCLFLRFQRCFNDFYQ